MAFIWGRGGGWGTITTVICNHRENKKSREQNSVHCYDYKHINNVLDWSIGVQYMLLLAQCRQKYKLSWMNINSVCSTVSCYHGHLKLVPSVTMSLWVVPLMANQVQREMTATGNVTEHNVPHGYCNKWQVVRKLQHGLTFSSLVLYCPSLQSSRANIILPLSS